MRQPIPAAGNPGGKARWTDKRDWMAEFPAESPSNPGLLAEATTLPILTRTAPRSDAALRIRTRTHRSILLTMSAMALMISASTAVVLWMRVALAPVPLAEWPVSPPPLFSQASAVPNPRLASALEVQPAARTHTRHPLPLPSRLRRSGSTRVAHMRLRPRPVRVLNQRSCLCSIATAWRSVR